MTCQHQQCGGRIVEHPVLGKICAMCFRAVQPPVEPPPQRETRLLVNGDRSAERPSARLTQRQRMDIRWKRLQHVPIREIADEYGIAERTVSRIADGTLAERFDRAVKQITGGEHEVNR